MKREREEGGGKGRGKEGRDEEAGEEDEEGGEWRWEGREVQRRGGGRRGARSTL